ncbi:hypothetical protein ACTXT7_010327 [Hymenolepis weldensis]
MRHLAQDLPVSEGTMRNVVHQALGYKSHAFLDKHPEEQECPWFYSDKKTFTRMKKSIEELIDGHVRADPIELSPVVHAHEGLRVNADADAYVETPQTIATKPLWIDSVDNGERSYLFQHGSTPSHKALKPRTGWMAENFHHHVTPNFLCCLLQPEEDYVEIELIDFSKTSTGVGAFLIPGPNGIGARVERLAKGELAEKEIMHELRKDIKKNFAFH